MGHFGGWGRPPRKGRAPPRRCLPGCGPTPRDTSRLLWERETAATMRTRDMRAPPAQPPPPCCLAATSAPTRAGTRRSRTSSHAYLRPVLKALGDRRHALPPPLGRLRAAVADSAHLLGPLAYPFKALALAAAPYSHQQKLATAPLRRGLGLPIPAVFRISAASRKS